MSNGSGNPLKRKMSLSNSRLIPRVKDLIGGQPAYRRLHVEDITADLKHRHPEYRRKKEAPFLKEVAKAFEVACRDLDAER